MSENSLRRAQPLHISCQNYLDKLKLLQAVFLWPSKGSLRYVSSTKDTNTRNHCWRYFWSPAYLNLQIPFAATTMQFHRETLLALCVKLSGMHSAMLTTSYVSLLRHSVFEVYSTFYKCFVLVSFF